MALGLRSVLEEDGIEVIGQESDPTRLVGRVQRLAPDVVVLDFDRDGARSLAEDVKRAAPRTKVILWARDESVIGVLESVHDAPRVVTLGASGLRNELQGRRHQDGLEE